MRKTIKTKEVVKDIKAHDATVNLGDRMKNIGVKTKETVNENTNQADNVSPEQYATDKVSEAMKSSAESTAVGTEKAVRKGVGKAKEKIKDKMAEKKEKANSANPTDDDPTKDVQANNKALSADDKKPASPKDGSAQPKTSSGTEKTSESAKYQPDKKTARTTEDKGNAKAVKEKQDIPAVKEKTQAPSKVKKQTETNIDEVKKPRQRKQSAPKTKGKPTAKKINADKQGVRTLGADAHKVKKLERSTAKSASKIKKADKAVKSADKSVKTAKNTVKTSTDVAKKTARAAKATVKVTVKAVKATAKAVVEAGKAVVAAVKELGALIVAGGVPAIVIVVVICLIGAIGGTCFGIFLANDETTGTQKTMSQAISELTSEHYANLTAMKASYTYDLIEIQGDTSINWKDVLAVYAIKTTSGENPLEVVTLDDEKMDLLRSIMKDMNKMTGVVTPKTVAETVITTDENGRQIKTTEHVTKQVLTVSVVQLSKEQIAQHYNFNDEQKAQLQELTSEEYDSLWNDLIGNSGEIIQGDSDFVGTDIFSWPLSINGTITSRFGTRVDPISGVVKTHGGTDIAAPEGTPILAAADGTVVAAKWHNSYGYYVKIQHNDNYSTLYAHCSVLYVSLGQTVKQGQIIAKVGSTGDSTGPHLHFEVLQNGVRVNALVFFFLS
ncbi:MAG: peptidoglycan DD-metalloendopeptidase family protein [Oscillospiraceae bacterium]|nr:peptidoglycan DD-metalloendopeptidase family protein [Oscillospiraceae bacterium]